MILSFLLFVVIIRYFPVYRTLMKVQPQQLKKLNQLVDSIRSLVGSDIVELSELKQEGNPVFKKMYLQINFKHFADLIQFYCICVYSLSCSFICVFQASKVHSISVRCLLELFRVLISISLAT